MQVTMEDYTPVKTRRRPNFSHAEMQMLIREVTARKDIIMGRSDLSQEMREAKNHAWEAVTEAVNTVSPIVRNVHELRRKLIYVQSSLKKKIKEPDTTPPLSSAEKAVADISNLVIDAEFEVLDPGEVPGDVTTETEVYQEEPVFTIEDTYTIVPAEMSPAPATEDTTPTNPSQEVSAPLDPLTSGQETESKSTLLSCDNKINKCKESWKNPHRTVIEKKKPLPSRSSRKSTKPNHLRDALQLLLPYLKQHQLTDTQGSQPYVRETSEEAEEGIIQDTLHEYCKRNVLQESDATPSTHSKVARARSAESRKRNNMSGFDQTFTDFVGMKKPRMNSDDDPRKLFLMSLLPDVHAMTEVQMRKFRKLVLQAVDTVLEEPLNNIHVDPFHTTKVPVPHVDSCHTAKTPPNADPCCKVHVVSPHDQPDNIPYSANDNEH